MLKRISKRRAKWLIIKKNKLAIIIMVNSTTSGIKLFPFAVCLFKLHLNHTAILAPNPTNLLDTYALMVRIRELKTAMMFFNLNN